MTTLKTWLASAALVGGAGGIAGVALASADESAPATATTRVATAPDASYLQQQISALLEEDQALKRAVAQARVRLAGQVHAGERSLALLHRRILAAEAALSHAQAAAPAASAPSAPAAPLAATRRPASAPATHVTSGASGAGSGHPGSAGEHDD